MKKIHPFDIIKIVQDIPATILLYENAVYTKSIPIVLPKDSILFSSTQNYVAKNKLTFVQHKKEQFDTIKNLYIQNTYASTKILGYAYSICVNDLNHNFRIIRPFDYKYLSPLKMPHICLISYLFLDARIMTVDTSKYLCFIADWKPIEETKTNFEIGLLTHLEALNIIACQIKQQIEWMKQ